MGDKLAVGSNDIPDFQFEYVAYSESCRDADDEGHLVAETKAVGLGVVEVEIRKLVDFRGVADGVGGGCLLHAAGGRGRAAGNGGGKVGVAVGADLNVDRGFVEVDSFCCTVHEHRPFCGNFPVFCTLIIPQNRGNVKRFSIFDPVKYRANLKERVQIRGGGKLWGNLRGELYRGILGRRFANTRRFSPHPL